MKKTLKSIQSKHGMLNESYAWERTPGKALPTLADVQSKYNAKSVNEQVPTLMPKPDVNKPGELPTYSYNLSTGCDETKKEVADVLSNILRGASVMTFPGMLKELYGFIKNLEK